LFEPGDAAKLYAEAYVARQAREKLAQSSSRLRRQLELRRHLYEHTGELLAERARAIRELFEQLSASAPQAALVGNLLRQLQRESEIGRRALGPVFESRERWNGVKGR